MDLAQQTGQVIDVGQRVRRNDEIHRTTGCEAKIGDIALMTLHRHLGGLGLAPEQCDPVGRRIDCEGSSTGRCQRNGIARSTDAELDDPFTGDVAAESQFALVGDR